MKTNTNPLYTRFEFEKFEGSTFFGFSFISADKSVGANGFKAVWTEIVDPSATCNEFRCTKSQFCIADKLRCNKVNNCGAEDYTDEENCKLKNKLLQDKFLELY